MDRDTIVAIATAPGAGGIGIIRLSGSKARTIGNSITGINLIPRHAHYSLLHNDVGVAVDDGISLFFPGPHSFTGEDIVELQAHGGPVILDILLREACRLGARQALPGEFSQRAYLNGKIDLAQAEAIADLINSTTEQAALAASRSLQGAFSEKINTLVSLVTNLRVYIEAAIDFPEEEIDFIQNSQVKEQLDYVIQQFSEITEQARQGSLLREGMKVVIAGKPNAGKSSLLNALSGNDTAIVTPVEGTTRDVLREHIQIDGMPLHIVDTAGLRVSGDEIEQEGIRRAWTEIDSADRILLVLDSSDPANNEPDQSSLWSKTGRTPSRDIPITIIRNKSDLANQPVGVSRNGNATVVTLSAKTGDGIALLKQHLKDCMGYQECGEGNFSARRRHLLSLEQAWEFLLNGQKQLLEYGAGELLAEDLRLSQNALGEITGAVTSDDLLGKIFSTFCIGK